MGLFNLIKDKIKESNQKKNYCITTMSGAGTPLPMNILMELENKVLDGAMKTLFKDVNFSVAYKTAIDCEHQKKTQSFHTMDQIDVVQTPLTWLSIETGVKYPVFQSMLGKSLFITKEIIQYNTYGQIRTASCTVVFYFP